MNIHNFNSNTKSWKMYTNTLTSISGDNLLVMPSYGKDIILEVSANNDIFFKKGTITKRFDNLVSDYLETSFNSLNSQVQYILQEISGSSVKDFITSGISNDLLIKSYDGRDIILEVSGNSEIIFKRGDFSYNLDDLIGGGGSQSSDYATYNILDITGKIIFTDNSGTSGTSGSSGSSSNIVLTSINGNIIPSIDNTFKLGDVSKNWSNAYITDISATNIELSGNLNVVGATKLANTLEISGNVTFGGSNLYVPSSFTIDPLGHGDNTGTVTINGNLVVQGVTTTINSSVVDISDKMIVLASNASNSLQADGAGFEISGAKVNFLYDNTSTTFRSSIGISISGNVVPVTSTGSLGSSLIPWGNAYIRDVSVTNIDVSGNLNPLIGNRSSLGSTVKSWGNAYIRDVSTTNIEVSGNIVPLLNINSNLGSSSNRWNKVFVNDLSVNTINGAAYSAGGGGSSTVLTSITSNVVPSTTNTYSLGDVSRNWNNAYISKITTSNIDVSNVVSIVKNNNQFVILGQIIDVSAVTDFGYQIAETVSLNDAGTIVAIGLPNNTINGILQVGSVIVYELNSYGIWIQKGQTLNGSSSEHFGWSVSLNGAGTRLAVGAPAYPNGSTLGGVKVYSFSGTTWTSLGGVIVGVYGTGTGEWCLAGRSVSLNSAGNIVAFGEPNTDNYNVGSGSGSVGQGRARVFQYNGSAWVQYGNNITALNTAFPNTYNQQGLGISISLNSSGNRVAIGAVQGDSNGAIAMYGPGHVLVFDLIGSTWTQVGQKLAGNSRDEIGSSCSLNATGNIVACGGRKTYPDGTGVGYGGVVRVYIQSGSTWILRGTPIYGEANYDYAGTSVSLNDTGNILAIGGPRNDANGTDTGHVRVYQYIDASSNWYQMGIDIDGRALPSLYYGRAVSLNAAGNRLAIGGVSSTSSSYTAVTEFKDYVNVGMTVFNSNIAPFTHNTCTLGTNLLRWNNIYTQALTNASDDRLKHNEVIINNGLDVIDQLTPKFYQKTDIMLDAHYNGDLTGYTWNYEAGLIAQELLQIKDLSFVVSDGDRYGPLNNLIPEPYSVNYNNVFVYGLAAIKELHQKVKAQETSISTLQTSMLEQQQGVINDMSSNINTLKDEITTLKQNMDSLLTRLQALETSAN